jgi:hypothetical protein
VFRSIVGQKVALARAVLATFMSIAVLVGGGAAVGDASPAGGASVNTGDKVDRDPG